MAVRVFTIPVPLPAALTVGITCTMEFGGVPKVFNSGVVAFPQITASSYPALAPLAAFAAKANALLRQWLLDAATALGITTRPALADVLLKFRFPQTLEGAVDANRIDITLDPTGFVIGADQAVLTAFSVDNTSGWATVLGTCRQSLTSKAGTIDANVGTVAGARQSPYLFVFKRSDRDEGEREVYPTFFTRALKDGSARSHIQDASKAETVIRLVDLDEDLVAGPLPVATFSQLSSGNSVLEFHSTDEDGLENCSGVYQNSDKIEEAYYYRVGLTDHVARADVVTGSPPTSITLFENHDGQASQGQTVYRLSEGEAMVRKAIEVGNYLLKHEPDDTTGGTRWKSEAYALNFDGEAIFFPERRDDFIDIYSLNLPLLRRDLPELLLL